MEAQLAVSLGKDSFATKTASRIAALDFTKGALVLFMVLYHWLNYFLGPGGISYRFLRFLPPSFIFITGFLVSNVYLAKYAVTDVRLPKRLLARGAKILCVFVGLNLAIALLLNGARNLAARDLWAVFVSGNVSVAGVGKAAAFHILVPISYLLFLAAILLFPYRFLRLTFHFVFGAAVAGILALSFAGMRSDNLNMVSVGLLGLIFGFFSLDRIQSFIAHPYFVAGLYLAYAVLLCFWEPNYIVHTFGVCLSVALLFLLGESKIAETYPGTQVILLGRYPLFAYIAQIGILQVMRRSLLGFGLGVGELVGTFLAAVLLTFLSVLAMELLRKNAVVDRGYRFIFG